MRERRSDARRWRAGATLACAALLAGADLLVIGRPITRASDPGAAAAAIAASLRRVAIAR